MVEERENEHAWYQMSADVDICALSMHAEHYADRATARKRVAHLVQQALSAPPPAKVRGFARVIQPKAQPEPKRVRPRESREVRRLWATLDRLGGGYERSNNIFIDACAAIGALRRIIARMAKEPL